jgi:hypothetical protein
VRASQPAFDSQTKRFTYRFSSESRTSPPTCRRRLMSFTLEHLRLSCGDDPSLGIAPSLAMQAAAFALALFRSTPGL